MHYVIRSTRGHSLIRLLLAAGAFRTAARSLARGGERVNATMKLPIGFQSFNSTARNLH